MAKLRLALAQFDFPVGAVAANAARMAELMPRPGTAVPTWWFSRNWR